MMPIVNHVVPSQMKSMPNKLEKNESLSTENLPLMNCLRSSSTNNMLDINITETCLLSNKEA
uniref:Putative ovule protein n=1 Tax=Solanum chacoense TaxID=4108 RepID=A0A0V0GPQ1_SOLCH